MRKPLFWGAMVVALLLAIPALQAARLSYDSHGSPIQTLGLGTVQTVSYTGTSAATSNVITSGGTNVIRVVCTTDCHVVISASPTATTSDTYLPANTVEYFKVSPGVDKVAFIQVSANGTGYVTEMD